MAETFLTMSEEETSAVAQRLAGGLMPGTFVLLYGDLGAGKTAFVKGLAAGLDVDPEAVSSPTFVLIQHYKGRLPLVHADLYRLENSRAVDDLGLEELSEGAVLAVEWAERLPRRPLRSIAVRMEDAGGDRRKITITRELENG